MKALDVMEEQFYSWRHKAKPKRLALFQLLNDEQKHSNFELSKVGGLRFGARLEELHNAKHPLHYVRTSHRKDDSLVWYRKSTADKCSVCRHRQTHPTTK